MKLEVFTDMDFIGLDLIPEDLLDRKFCGEINQAFKAGDLHMRTDESCLIIEYDGKKRSFPIIEKECEAISKSLDAVFNGTARFLVGSVLICDVVSKELYCICIIRLLGKVKTEGRDLQKKLVRSYIPPLSSFKKSNFNGGKKKLSVQEKITDEPFFSAPYRPLFSIQAARKKGTKQKVLIKKDTI